MQRSSFFLFLIVGLAALGFWVLEGGPPASDADPLTGPGAVSPEGPGERSGPRLDERSRVVEAVAPAAEPEAARSEVPASALNSPPLRVRVLDPDGQVITGSLHVPHIERTQIHSAVTRRENWSELGDGTWELAKELRSGVYSLSVAGEAAWDEPTLLLEWTAAGPPGQDRDAEHGRLLLHRHAGSEPLLLERASASGAFELELRHSTRKPLLEGQLVDVEGQPLRPLVMRADLAIDLPDRRLESSTTFTADHDGGFLLGVVHELLQAEGLPAQAAILTLRIHRGGNSATSMSSDPLVVHVDAESSLVDLGTVVMTGPPIVVAGRVLDGEGRPVRRATVTVSLDPGLAAAAGTESAAPGAAELQVVTDHEGYFVVRSNAVCATLDLHATARNVMSGSLLGLAAGSIDVLVELQPLGSVELRVGPGAIQAVDFVRTDPGGVGSDRLRIYPRPATEPPEGAGGPDPELSSMRLARLPAGTYELRIHGTLAPGQTWTYKQETGFTAPDGPLLAVVPGVVVRSGELRLKTIELPAVASRWTEAGWQPIESPLLDFE